MRVESSLIYKINQTIDLFEEKIFSETTRPVLFSYRFFVAVKIPENSPVTTRLIMGIIMGASALAYEKEEAKGNAFSVFASEALRLYGRPYSRIEETNQVDPNFIKKIREYVHVYLHYLAEGWNLDSIGECLSRREYPLAVSVPIELDLSGYFHVALSFTYKRSHNLNGEEIRLALFRGKEKELERLMERIRDEASTISQNVLKGRITSKFLQRRAIGKETLNDLVSQLREEFLDKSRQFLLDKRAGDDL